MPPFELSRVTEDDLLDYAKIHYLAFLPFLPELYTSELSPSSLALLASQRASTLSSPTTIMHKLVDPETGTMIAGATWRIYTTKRTPAEVEADLQGKEAGPPEELADLREYFMRGIYAARREVMGGKPHLLLSSLTVHPDWQRKGAGVQVMEWGVAEADRLGLPMFLEATPAGKPLYERYGFETVGEIHSDIRPWGGKQIVNWKMVRQPKCAQ